MTLLVGFDGLSKAAEFVNRIFDSRLLPAAVEVMTPVVCRNALVDGTPSLQFERYVAAVALEAHAEAVDRMHRDITAMAESCGVDTPITLYEDMHRAFWFKIDRGARLVEKKDARLITVVLNYAVSNWKDLFQFAEADLSAEGFEHTILTHAGLGISKISLLMAEGKAGGERIVGVLDRLLDRCVQAGGNMVVHEAPADLKPRLNMWGRPGSDFIVMQRIKQHLDPNGIMCPGRFSGGL
jgi:glycolate oxidase FAD binding subunit